MANLNKVFLIGRLTQDPELRFTPNRTAVIDLRLATSRSWTNRDGEQKDDTLFIDVTVWNRQAEMCGQYLKKGSQVHVEGYLRSESWETSAGEKRSKVKVEAERVQFLDRREAPAPAEAAGSDDEPGMSHRPAPAAAAESRGAARSYGSQAASPIRPAQPEDNEEDIPF
jgi:single-strand DNA-binding protein